MMHEKSEIDSTSTSPSRESPKCDYIVESPSSNDSNDGKSSTNSRHTTPTESPSHDSSHSRMSSESRVSGPYRFLLVGKHRYPFYKRKKGWSSPLFGVIDEENEDFDDDDDDYYHDYRKLTRRCQLILCLIGFLMVFMVICLITWGASRTYKFHVHMKSWKVNNFYYGEGLDHTGVSTKLLTINCTVKMSIHNPATFFGIHVSSTSLNLLYSRVVVGSGQFVNYYQPKKSQKTMEVNLEGRMVPLYGAAWGLVSADDNGSVPLKLEFEIHSKTYLIGRLVKTRHRRQVLCIMKINSQNSKVIAFKKDSCSYY